MRLIDLITAADEAYDMDGLVWQYYDAPEGNHGDTLAKFIAVELNDTYDPGATGQEQLREAIRAMTSARDQLQAVVDALENMSI